jgi:hypothetical protein
MFKRDLPFAWSEQAASRHDLQKFSNIKRSTWRAHLTGTLVPITLALAKTQTGKLPLKP